MYIPDAIPTRTSSADDSSSSSQRSLRQIDDDKTSSSIAALHPRLTVRQAFAPPPRPSAETKIPVFTSFVIVTATPPPPNRPSPTNRSAKHTSLSMPTQRPWLRPSNTVSSRLLSPAPSALGTSRDKAFPATTTTITHTSTSSLSLQPTTADSGPPPADDTKAIGNKVGIVVASVLVSLLVVAVVYWNYTQYYHNSKEKKKRANQPLPERPDTYGMLEEATPPLRIDVPRPYPPLQPFVDDRISRPQRDIRADYAARGSLSTISEDEDM